VQEVYLNPISSNSRASTNLIMTVSFGEYLLSENYNTIRLQNAKRYTSTKIPAICLHPHRLQRNLSNFVGKPRLSMFNMKDNCLGFWIRIRFRFFVIESGLLALEASAFGKPQCQGRFMDLGQNCRPEFLWERTPIPFSTLGWTPSMPRRDNRRTPAPSSGSRYNKERQICWQIP
jgi:hypothetical protein